METKLNINTIPEGSISSKQITSVIDPAYRDGKDIVTAFGNLNDIAFSTFEFAEDADGAITGYLCQNADRIPIQIWLINRAMFAARGLTCRFIDNNNKQYVTSKCTFNFQTNYFTKGDFTLGDTAPTLKAYFDDFIIISNFSNDGVTFRKIKPEDDVLETDMFMFCNTCKYSTILANKVRLHNVWMKGDEQSECWYKWNSPIVEFNMEDCTIENFTNGQEIIINNVTLKYDSYKWGSSSAPLVVRVKKMYISSDDLHIYIKNTKGTCQLTYNGSTNNFTRLVGILPGEEKYRNIFIPLDLHSSMLYGNEELTEKIETADTLIYVNARIVFDSQFEDSFGNRGRLADRLPYNAYDNRGRLLWGCNNCIEYGPLSVYGIHKINGSFNIINTPQAVDVTGNYQVIS